MLTNLHLYAHVSVITESHKFCKFASQKKTHQIISDYCMTSEGYMELDLGSLRANSIKLLNSSIKHKVKAKNIKHF